MNDISSDVILLNLKRDRTRIGLLFEATRHIKIFWTYCELIPELGKSGMYHQIWIQTYLGFVVLILVHLYLFWKLSCYSRKNYLKRIMSPIFFFWKVIDHNIVIILTFCGLFGKTSKLVNPWLWKLKEIRSTGPTGSNFYFAWRYGNTYLELHHTKVPTCISLVINNSLISYITDKFITFSYVLVVVH